ncbi:MAG TPA: TonB-dependent receptor, partial [Vicinamibacteria bacterium]
MFQRPKSAWLLALAFASAAIPALAQSNGAISGVVRDASGAGVPGAVITITNQATKASHDVTSAPDGSFTASVPPGVYSATASVKGFAKWTHKDLKVDAGGTATANFTLEAQLAEEITVTAMKREETVFNTPVSVAAPTEAVLRSRGVEDIEGVAANVAGLSVQNLGPGQSQVAIRGASSGQIARDQPGVKESVGAYLDESVISLSLFTPDIDLFDVSRVEVLRGPQGTLFGSGSLSGTVRYISNQPEMGAKKVFGEIGGSTLDGGSQGGNIKLGFNAPLGEKAAIRMAGYYNHLAGYIDAVQPDLSVEENVNSGDRTGVRAAVRIAPSDRLTITPRVFFQRAEMDGWNRIDDFNILANPYTTSRPAVTLGGRRIFTQIGEPFTDDFLLTDLNVGYDFGNVTLTSITSYTYRDILVVRDAGALTASITGGTVGLPENVYTLDAPLDDLTTAKVWTQEVRLSGGKDRVRWVGGGFYSNTKRDYAQHLLVNNFEELSGIPTRGLLAPKNGLFWSALGYNLDQFALFGEATFNVSDRLSLTGGLRYYNFSEDKT